MGRIVTAIPRPEKAIIDRYRAVLFGQIVRRLDRTQLMDDAIRPLLSHKHRIVGPAVTASSDEPDFMMGILASGVAQPGDVILIAPGAHTLGAAWGAGLTISADVRGCEGVVVDGLVTDAPNIDKCATPVFCRGSTLRTHPNADHGSVNEPIICGGAPVSPGDLVVGDLDGVCIIPRLAAAELIDEIERESREILAGGERMRAERATIFDLMGGPELAQRLGLEWI